MTIYVVLLSVLSLLSAVKGQNNNQFETIYTVPLSNFPLGNIEFDPWSNNAFFVSGKNVLYKFITQDGNMANIPVRSMLTGPNDKCLPAEEDTGKYYCGDDYNSVMVITPDSLITCSTLYGGRCFRRHKTFLNDTLVGNSNFKLVSSPDASAVGLYLNLNGDASKNVLLFAKEYTPLPLALVSIDRAAIFSISQNLSGKFFDSEFRKEDIFDILLKKEKKDSVRMDYRVVLENEEFVFLLVNQNSQAKLVKICKTINAGSPKKVYEDIPLTCSGEDGTHFPRVVHGTFVYVSDKRYLVALFTNSTVSSAICVYEENEIYKAFLESRNYRYGCPRHDLTGADEVFDDIKPLLGDTCINITSNMNFPGTVEALTEEKFCNNITAPQFGIIVGLSALNGTAVHTSTDLYTVVGSTVVNDLVTLYIGTEGSYVVKVFLDQTMPSALELEKIKVPQDKSEIKAVRNVQGKLYFMSQNKIVKLRQEKNCAQFTKDCQTCMGAKDSQCGWCISTFKCTMRAACTGLSNYWLPSVKNQCLDLRFKNNSLSLALQLNTDLKVNITVSFVPRIHIEQTMACRLGGIELTSYPERGLIKCLIDQTGGRNSHEFPEGNTTLEILLNNRQIAARDILFYNCSQFKSCGTCLGNSNTECYWCTDEPKCLRAIGDCPGPSNRGIDKMNSCPQISSQIVKIPSGRMRDLEFQGVNLDLPSNFQYQCYYDSKKSYTGQMVNKPGNNSLLCKDVQIEGDTQTTMRFRYGVGSTTDVDLETFDGVPSVIGYLCQSLSPQKDDCSTCHYLNQTEGYECHWCQKKGCVDIDDEQCEGPEDCSKPVVTKIEPADGPVRGGTEVTIEGFNFGLKSGMAVTIAGIECENVKFRGRRLTCKTGSANDNAVRGPVVVTVDGQNSDGNVLFSYQEPRITGISPNQTILSGGRIIKLTGTYLNTGNMKYDIEIISTEDKNNKFKCITVKKESVDGKIACRPTKANKDGMYKVEVTFDGTTKIGVAGLTFQYLKDPVITGTDPTELKSISSGGLPFFVNGDGFVSAIETLSVEIKDTSGESTSCTIISKKKLRCEFPNSRESENRRRKRATRSFIVIHLDGFSYEVSSPVTYVDDPTFRAFHDNSTYLFDPSEQDAIVLVGEGLSTVTRKEDYLVLIGSGECAITSLNKTELICRPPNKEPAPRHQEKKLYIRVRVGFAGQVVGVVEYASELPITIIIIVVLGILLVAFCVVAFMVHRRVKTRNQLKIEEIMTEMHDIEQNTIRMNQEEFAEMQLNITDIKRDLVSSGIPYHPYQNYVQYILFPKEVEAGTLNSLIKHSGYASKNVEKAMDQFDKLMTNKYFVKSLIGTLEKQRKITLIDKAQFSANFSVVMMGKMRDFFDIVNCLLSTLVDSANKKAHKTLFNRFESITLRLLSHWLSVSLFPYLKEGGGSSLFMLYKSTQAVVEKRPVDEVTGEAKNTLSEDSFLREKIDCQALKLEIDLNGNGNLYTCEVLDCDTINQVKSKCLYQIYKNKPASEMPTIDEVDLEWMAGKSGRLALSNIDQTSVREDNMVRRNTLQHYNVLDGSKMALLYKFSPDDEHTEEHEEDPYVNQRSPSDVEISIPPDVHLIQSVSSTGSLEHLRQWHLVKSLEEEEDSHEKTVKLKDIVKTSHITNLMHTKLVLQDNIKEVFDSVLNHDTVPLVVHYLFGVLENLANKNGVEPDTLLCWKSESYAMRVWATLLVRPEFLFDIQKTKHVEPCLNVIKQVFIDCFHSTKISKDSSLQKLLFAQEVPHYQKKTEQFYKALANKAAVTDSDFWSEMSRLNGLQQEHLKFSKAAALQKLYKFVQQYVEDIIEDLDAGDETSDLQFGSKLDDVVRLMETDS